MELVAQNLLEVIPWLSIAMVLGCLVVSVLNWRHAPRLRSYSQVPPSQPLPRVSILVPARNEAENLRQLLPQLLQSSYANLELIVLDDHSNDDTQALCERLGVQCVAGAPLPRGWTGKNWACWQLAQLASGDIFLFVDADVLPSSDAVPRTIACMEQDALSGLSCFVRQVYASPWLGAAIPFVMELPIIGWIPLALIPDPRMPGLIAANGQWLAVRRNLYFELGGHSQLRDRVLEDIELAKRIKAAGAFKTLLATDDIEVRMYVTLREMWNGFAKNLFLLFGGSAPRFGLFLAFFAILYICPWIALFSKFHELALISLGLTGVWRLIVAGMMRSRLAYLTLHPLGVLVSAGILLLSAKRFYFGGNHWKGRPLDSAPKYEALSIESEYLAP